VKKNGNCANVRATLFGCGPYYDNYMQQSYNHPDDRVTPSGCDPNMETRGAHYGKPIAKFTVRTLLATVRMLPREIHFRLVLGLLSLYIDASRHVFYIEFGIEFFMA
jgi:hypothetical protein